MQITPAVPPSFRKASADLLARVEFLERFKGANDRTERLADKLRSCTFLQPCDSGACPVCVQAASNELVEDLRLGSQVETAPLLWVTLVPTGPMTPPGALHLFSPENHKRRLKASLAAVDFDWAVFVMDISFNEHSKNEYAPFWCAHWHGVVAGADEKVLRKQLSAVFKPSIAVLKPVDVKVWDGELGAPRYLLTSDFDRRIGIDGVRRFNKLTGKPRAPCRGTRCDTIRAGDMVELLIWLDDAPIESRVTPIRCQSR